MLFKNRPKMTKKKAYAVIFAEYDGCSSKSVRRYCAQFGIEIM